MINWNVFSLHGAWLIINAQEVFIISQEAITVLDGGNRKQSWPPWLVPTPLDPTMWIPRLTLPWDCFQPMIGQCWGRGHGMPVDWGLLLVHFATRMLLQVLALLWGLILFLSHPLPPLLPSPFTTYARPSVLLSFISLPVILPWHSFNHCPACLIPSWCLLSKGFQLSEAWFKETGAEEARARLPHWPSRCQGGHHYEQCLPHLDSDISSNPVAAEFFVGDLERHPGIGEAPPRAAIQVLEKYEGVIATRTVELAGYC